MREKKAKQVRPRRGRGWRKHLGGSKTVCPNCSGKVMISFLKSGQAILLDMVPKKDGRFATYANGVFCLDREDPRFRGKRILGSGFNHHVCKLFS